MRTEEILANYRRLIRRYKEKSPHIIVSGILPRIDGFTGFHRKTSNINDRLKYLCRDEEVTFTNAWEHFHDNHDLNEIGYARLGKLLNDEVLMYSKNSKRARDIQVP